MNELTTATSFKSLKQFLEHPSVVKQVANALNDSGAAQKILRQALTLAQANPKLLECSQMSVAMGVLRAAELNLSLSANIGHAYLVPRWSGKTKTTEATFQVGWKGLVALAMRSGLVSSMPVRTVYEKDYFSVRYGTSHGLDHQPAVSDRGEAVGYYAIVNYRSGGFDFEYMSVDDVDKHRKKYVADSRGQSIWDTSPEEMGQKTVVRRLCRRLSLCPEAQSQSLREEHEDASIRVETISPQAEEVLRIDFNEGVACEQEEDTAAS